ncbi:MAG TPA: DNA-protecting protein DprA [Candidatus Fimisoma avicola]|uniref:DNA-protecting protein DprA n=1 Tax=Candidatus Fimisoma avicola TaxID=2840826 RepID=A0A9D1I3E9_9FIRM|nr:DNA-protecting protein DprA [Candidatus Fimisoma avicola]
MHIRNNIESIRICDREYPELLKNIKDPPDTIYFAGDIALIKGVSAAVVGTRKCSEYGRQTALRIGRMLGKNKVTVVSGMAAGIDAHAHAGALDAGGKTVAVLACGPDICYPRENRKIYEMIREKGLIISEHPPGTEPKPWHFPMRNRIISGVSLLTVVVEAGTGSGAIITAQAAAEQGRDVMAVPGNINSPYSLGANKLIADGAAAVTVPEDILRAAGIEPVMEAEEMEKMGGDEQKVYRLLLEKGELTVEELCAYMDADSFTVNGLVSVMELKGVISYCLGKIFIAKS